MSDFGQLLRGLTERANTRPQMVRAMVELTYGCNLRCVHCYNPTHQAKNELTTEQVFQILDGLAAQGCLWVVFTGGALFTRRDSLAIMRYAKQRGLIFSILTNATLITPTLADQLKALEPYHLDISMYGATAETYEKVTHVPGSYAKFVSGVDLLREREIPILLKLVLMTLNVHELEAMREFALTRGIRYGISTEIHPKVDGSLEPLAYRLSPEQAFEIWRKFDGERQRNGSLGSIPGEAQEDSCWSAGQLFDCLCGKSSAAITPYGKLNLCLSMQHPQYDLTTGSVAEGWQGLVDLVAQANPGPAYECGGCALAKLCRRGTMDGWLQQGVFDGPCIPYFKEVAKRKVEFLRKEGG